MILIISKYSDQSTNDVANWLHHNNYSFQRINTEDKFQQIHYKIDNVTEILLKSEKVINFNHIKSYWYRRGNFSFEEADRVNTSVFNYDATGYLFGEQRELRNLFHQQLVKKKGINHFSNNQLLKLDILEKASECGLMIPGSLVTNSKEDLKRFKNEYQSIITKAIYNALIWYDSAVGSVQNYTSEVSDETIAKLPDVFFPSLFQQKIDKKYELRIFYLDGICYSMAIFSQNDACTQTDFRNYNRERPNRNVPFQLPDIVQNKIVKLMNKLELNSGSLDILVDQDQNYIFLEVNPVGQFGMTSMPCNYYLEKKIAEKLIEFSNE